VVSKSIHQSVVAHINGVIPVLEVTNTPLTWRQRVPPKRWYPSNRRDAGICEKTVVFNILKPSRLVSRYVFVFRGFWVRISAGTPDLTEVSRGFLLRVTGYRSRGPGSDSRRYQIF
jgi:hypothetical protein